MLILALDTSTRIGSIAVLHDQTVLAEVVSCPGEPYSVSFFGDLEGLLTLHDILQALVGELPGGVDSDPRVVHRDDGSWLFDGMVALDEVKQALQVPLTASRKL